MMSRVLTATCTPITSGARGTGARFPHGPALAPLLLPPCRSCSLPVLVDDRPVFPRFFLCVRSAWLRTQMARLEKQLHDTAGASQPQSERAKASAPATVTTPSPPATVTPPSPPTESMGAAESKEASAPEDTGDQREPCRNTKYSAAASSQGTMRTSLEQQHAATQVRAWGAWNVSRTWLGW